MIRPHRAAPRASFARQARADEFAGEEGDPEAEAEAAAAEASAAGGFPWSGTDRDYTYDELLGGWRPEAGVWGPSNWEEGQVCVCVCVRVSV